MDLSRQDRAGSGFTDGTLLDGRLRYRQPANGYRTGLEPVLLAASVPARPGERVVEAGTGAGAGLMCLLHRVPDLSAEGVERDAAMAGMARHNLAANGFAEALITCAAIEAWRPLSPIDHAFANPPWHEPAGTASPSPGRDTAKRAAPGLLAAWAQALARALRPRGTLSFILPAAALADGVATLHAAKCPQISLLPLWPRAGVPARLIILRGVRLGRGASAVLPGLVLHEGDGGFTAAAEGVLRGSASF
jgi:tRNA1(Val) A37 N6-methylase TrmN6